MCSTPQNRPLVTQPLIEFLPITVSASSAPAIEPDVLTSMVAVLPAGKSNAPMPVRWVTVRSAFAPESSATV